MRLRRIQNVIKMSHPEIEDKAFVIVIASYKNEDFCLKNLRSVFDQTYRNYRVIYIDDCSPDGTYNAAKEIIEKYRMNGRVQITRNQVNVGAMANLYNAIHSCRNDEIVVLLDGDDWFANENVLSQLNKYYANPKVWLTYGQYLEYPSYQMGMSEPMSMSTLKFQKARVKPWVSSHLRTFYAGLFNRIAKDDLQYEGKFFPTTYDLACMFPMIEMATDHVFFTPDIFYIYNFDNPINDGKVHRTKQVFFEEMIRAKNIYKPLKCHPGEEV